MIFKDGKFSDRKRNTTNWYGNSVDRAMSEAEIRRLLECQRSFGNPLASEDFEEEIIGVFSWQLPFASADRILKMVGECTFIPGERRAPRNAYHSERFVTLQKINSLTYSTNGSRLRLDEAQRRLLADLSLSVTKLSYAQIRKHLSLPDEARFPGLTYVSKDKATGNLEESLNCEKTTCLEMKGYHAMKKAFDSAGVWQDIQDNPDMMDDIAYALTFYKTDEDIGKHLQSCGVEPRIVEAATACQAFTATSNLSLAAIKGILPYLEQGMLYNEACEAAGFDHANPRRSEKADKLPPISPDVTRNPVVLRALSQARKVVNAIIREYGAPTRIHVEFAREMGKSPKDRKEIQKRQEDGRAENERVKQQIRDSFGREPNGEDVLKFRLYAEQGGKCAYSQATLEISRLFEPYYVEIDHIVPYSRCFDDSRANKALVLASENQRKRNQTPYECFGADESRWANFEAWVRAAVRDHRKRNNLLRKNVDEEEWKERSLQDTKYIARAFARFLRENLKFADPEVMVPVVCVNGQLTAKVRGLWGLSKDREENDLHHALDAAVVASLVQHQITLMTEFYKLRESGGQLVDTDTGEVMDPKQGRRPRLPMPWKSFRQELIARLSEDPAAAIRQLELSSYENAPPCRPITVSRMPQRKASGAIHAETIRSAKMIDSERKSAVRKPLTSLSTGDLNNLVCRESDPALYEAICSRMEEHAGKADKAFAEPLHKPTKDGTPGPAVKSVKVYQPQYTGVNIRNGIADNGDMACVLVSRKHGKKQNWQYYFTPVYVADVMAGVDPEVLGDFVFLLFPYDLIRLGPKASPYLGYYRKYNRNTQSVTICEANNAQKLKQSIGVRNLDVLEKYEMGVLGEYSLCGESLSGLANGSDIEPGETEGEG